jgi:uncharacterized protein (TIGR03118 family)
MYCSLVKGAAHVTILVGSILSTTVVGVADGFLETDLVSDLPGRAKTLDPNLVNAWGLATSSTSPFWVANNGTGTSTLYNKQGVPQPPGTNPPHDPLIVSIPIPSNPTGRDGTPTGAVFNIGSSSGAFPIPPIPPTGTTTKPSIFLFATEDGTIVGWNPAINPPGSDPTLAGTFGTIAVDNSGNNFANPPPANPTGAVYKGLAIAHANQPIF